MHHALTPFTVCDADTMETTDDCLPDSESDKDLGTEAEAAQTSMLSIGHKGFLALLVPSGRLHECLMRAGVTGREPLAASRDKLRHLSRRSERLAKKYAIGHAAASGVGSSGD